MKGRKQKAQAVPPPDAAIPFFARFLEDQHSGDAAAKPATQFATLKYPSDRDEWEDNTSNYVEAAPTEAAPSRMTLKYPSDRDEIDWYDVPRGNAADAR
ncbi:MAG: microviridin/marinostatin family tricyclic proteinase inhibitor [Pyrinomonadaceae bacterium]